MLQVLYEKNRPFSVLPSRAAAYIFPFVIAIAVAIFYLVKSGGRLEVSNDAPSYLYYGAERPLGYPLFLSIVRGFSHSLSVLPTVQFILLGASVGALGLSLRWAAGWLASMAFLVLAAANSTYWESASSIQSEALSFVATNLFCALVLFNVKTRRSELRIAYVIVTTLAIALRPVNLAFLPASVLAILVLDGGAPLRTLRRSYRSLLALGLGALLAWYSAQIGELVRGQPVISASPFARGLLTKTLFFQAPPNPKPGAASPDERLIEAAIKPINAYLAAAPADLADFLRMDYYENSLRFNYIIPALARAHGFEHAYRLDPRLGAYSIAKIEQAPASFISACVREYWYFISYKGYHSAAFRESALAFVSRHHLVVPPSVPPLAEDLAQQARARVDLGLSPSALSPVVGAEAVTQIVGKSRFVVVVMRLFHGVAALLGLAALALLVAPRSPRPLRPLLAALAVLAVVLHGEALITAVSEASLRRYVVPLWTVISAGYCFAAAALLAHFVKSDRSIYEGEGPGERQKAQTI